MYHIQIGPRLIDLVDSIKVDLEDAAVVRKCHAGLVSCASEKQPKLAARVRTCRHSEHAFGLARPSDWTMTAGNQVNTVPEGGALSILLSVATVL
jgi:hypothetical protein